jgi:hypothetical protein
MTAQTSLGLAALCQMLQDAPSRNILELGPARGSNIEFWSRFGSSLYIADLRASLPLPSLSEDQERSEADWSRVLELPEDRRFDVILAWDLFNYIDLASLPSLIRFLTRFCHPGTIVFSLIFDQPQMPAEITVYRILDEGHLSYDSSSSGARPCPRHQPRALAGVMHRFRTANSFRLRNGVVEYLFAYEGEAAP